MTDFLYQNNVAESLYRINSTFHSLRFEEMTTAKRNAYLKTLANYSEELATVANDWKEENDT